MFSDPNFDKPRPLEKTKTFKKMSQDANHVKIQYLNKASIDFAKNWFPLSLNTQSFDLLSNEIKKFQEFLEVNKLWSNSKMFHFEVKEIEDVELTKPKNFVDKVNYENTLQQMVRNLNPLLELDISYRLNQVSVHFVNYPCSNDRVTDTLTLTDLQPGEKNCLFFQILYIKLIFQMLNYKLKKDTFYKSVCIHQLSKPTTFVYLIGYLKYTFQTEYFISMSLLNTEPVAVSESKAEDATQTGYQTRAARAQTTERLLLELNNKFLARGTNITAAFYELFKNQEVKKISYELYTEPPSLTADDLLFSNFPLTLMDRYIQQNILFDKQLNSLKDTYSIFRCSQPVRRGQKACILNQDFFDKKIKKVGLEKQKQKLIQKLDTYKHFSLDINTASTQIKRNEPVFLNNAYSSIFLTEGK